MEEKYLYKHRRNNLRQFLLRLTHSHRTFFHFFSNSWTTNAYGDKRMNDLWIGSPPSEHWFRRRCFFLYLPYIQTTPPEHYCEGAIFFTDYFSIPALIYANSSGVTPAQLIFKSSPRLFPSMLRTVLRFSSASFSSNSSCCSFPVCYNRCQWKKKEFVV